MESTEIIIQPEPNIDAIPPSLIDIKENQDTEITTLPNEIDSIEEVIVDKIESEVSISPESDLDDATVQEAQGIPEAEQILSIEELQGAGSIQPGSSHSTLETLETLDATEQLLTENNDLKTQSDEIIDKAVDVILHGENIETESDRITTIEDLSVADEQSVIAVETVSEFSVPTKTTSVEESLEEALENTLSPRTDSKENTDESNLKEIDLIDGNETELIETEKNKGIIDYARPIISKTLAEIYASQGEYREAIETYSILMKIRPTRKGEIEIRIRELEEELSKTRSEQN
ncbi:MAG: hypothetical protein C0417_05655 [Chlorobiaceae bacterium]|nr:hypothetical protein [Chlorobiaceae bacterium]